MKWRSERGLSSWAFMVYLLIFVDLTQGIQCSGDWIYYSEHSLTVLKSNREGTIQWNFSIKGQYRYAKCSGERFNTICVLKIFKFMEFLIFHLPLPKLWLPPPLSFPFPLSDKWPYLPPCCSGHLWNHPPLFSLPAALSVIHYQLLHLVLNCCHSILSHCYF